MAEGKKLHMNKLWLLIPSFFDLLTSTMQYIAFNFISTSAYQILKGGMIVTTFLFSITFLKQPIIRKQLVGSILALAGILIVGIANVIFTKQSSYEGNAVHLYHISVSINCWVCADDWLTLYEWIFFCILAKAIKYLLC